MFKRYYVYGRRRISRIGLMPLLLCAIFAVSGSGYLFGKLTATSSNAFAGLNYGASVARKKKVPTHHRADAATLSPPTATAQPGTSSLSPP